MTHHARTSARFMRVFSVTEQQLFEESTSPSFEYVTIRGAAAALCLLRPRVLAFPRHVIDSLPSSIALLDGSYRIPCSKRWSPRTSEFDSAPPPPRLPPVNRAAGLMSIYSAKTRQGAPRRAMAAAMTPGGLAAAGAAAAECLHFPPPGFTSLPHFPGAAVFLTLLTVLARTASAQMQ